MTTSEYELGKELFAYIKAKNAPWNIFNPNNFTKMVKNQILKFSTASPLLQSQLFRFVDVLPALRSDQQISQYLFEYLGPHGLGNRDSFLADNPLINKVVNLGVDFSVKLLAKTFIVGSNVTEALTKISELHAKGQSYTLDILGELALSDEEADHYLDQYLDLIQKIPQANISVKLSALCAQVNPLDFDGKKSLLKNKLRKIYKAAKQYKSFINVDTEHYYWKDLTFEVVRELLSEDEFKDWSDAGIVIQAYLRDSEQDLRDWLLWSRQRACPITVRLVKGAYWDYEHAHAKQHNWDCPVYTDKYESDVNYEKLTKILFDNHKYLRPAIASHNVRSIAHAIDYAESIKLDKSQYEFQMLYGMMDALKDYFVEKGHTIRVYMPYGELVLGMSYLVRRLLENTANDSFLKQGFLDGKSEDKLLVDPKTLIPVTSPFSNSKTKTSECAYPNFAKPGTELEFDNEPDSDFSKALNRDQMQDAINKMNSELYQDKLYPLIINDQEIYNDNSFEPMNPAGRNQMLARISHATTEHCDAAIDAAYQAYKLWSKADPSLRAKVLRQVAHKLRTSRYRFNALMVIEAAKPWLEADSEVSEAIDFLEYYAEQALALFSEGRLRSLPGESNINRYQAYGVSLVISPWNFPLALMVGMMSAALVAGNAVIVKPSQQTSLVAHEFINLFNSVLKQTCSKYAKGLVNLLTGEGSSIGSYLVEHPKTKLVAFTGSNATGMAINEAIAKSRQVKRLVAEMGGKNTIIVDLSADLDEAVPGVVHSAFGYAGQKCSACSRVVVHEDIYDQFVERLVAATRALNICDPADQACTVPPQIDMAAQLKTNRYIEMGKQDGTMLLGDLELPDIGFYSSPTIFTDLEPDHALCQEEIFGPVLVVMKARDTNHAIELANNTDYGLTGGIYSRSPSVIDQVTQELQVGNLYINRACTGAIVSRQAFGGLKQSSIGFKAGGPNYLLQFVQEKTITENTMRRGFTAD